MTEVPELYMREHALYAKGCTSVAGIDEVGYGALAGPITVAICVLDPEKPIEDLKDSKKFSSHKRRAQVAQDIRENALDYHIAFRSNEAIDQYGIVGALQQAQLECISKLAKMPDRILIDGTPFKVKLDCDETYIVKGDATVACIAAASIIAKVARDELMMELEARHPEYVSYGFAQNKGYGSAAHREALGREGLTRLHRKSYCANLV